MFSKIRSSTLRSSLIRYHFLSTTSSRNNKIPFDTQVFPFSRFEPCCPVSDVAPATNGFVPCQKHPLPNVLGRKIDMTMPMTGRSDTERHVVMCVGPNGREWERAKVETVVDGPVYASNQLYNEYLRSPAHRNNDIITEKDTLMTVCDRIPTSNNNNNNCDVMVFPEFVFYPSLDPAQLATSDVAKVLQTIWHNPSHPTLPVVAGQQPIKDENGDPVDTVVLVCTHERRDMRCGKIGPLIMDAFKKSIQKRHHSSRRILIYGTSHFGGHKFAGNVIIHQKGLGGHMYGNVRDCMVDDIVDRHIFNGKVIKELWRGQVTPPTLS
ncbi:Sucrase/ferredoxin-like-domain-containing protein [Halteromyces radiatus]|uniref:Sucrase/ferredoxin-like-domain-containing protein n=1 Tax=Halteromyces radiatus TaxID=101107 RepID=UPI0022208566|nr:Sucrase/ferredoxin-like-domain-containing protein [Halteromyces radiatus]KAI8092776.1 Sucrase/ferredoxin-like-domain-containing protein [Halteromyces radiatus]